MEIIRDISILVLGLLVYSGSFVPLAATLLIWTASRERFRRNRMALFIATSLQALFFLPFVFAELDHQEESEHLLTLPALTGVVMFIAFSIYAVRECVSPRASIHSHHDTYTLRHK